jgi:hypothetical protein
VRSESSAASSKKLEDKRMKNDGTEHTHQRSTLYAQQVTVWRFTFREKDTFLFQPPMQSGRGIEEPKSLEV